ncbi:MAG: glycosyltransferase family 4 protein [Alphaproteobacteria bacterium]
MPPPVRVFIADAGRHKQPSGYGKNARSFIRTLGRDPRFTVVVQRTDTPWGIDAETQARLGTYEEADTAEAGRCDCVLQVGAAMSCRRFDLPSLIFSCCDVSDLPPSQVQKLRNADGVIAPNAANFRVYSSHFENVFLAQQGIDEQPFKPRKNDRADGQDVFTFLFVGSFSYRKGVDVLISAFLAEFTPDEAHLHIHMPGEQTDRAANDIIARMNQKRRLGRFSLSSDNLSEAWLCRFYNRTDCFVTCTRGEGWGLPIVEAMLCGLPVIAPFASGMADYLNPDVALPIATTPRRAADISDPFGENFRKTYGVGKIAFHEPEMSSVRRQMRAAWEAGPALAVMGARGREHILTRFSEDRFGRQIADAILALLQRQKAPALAAVR